MSEPEGPPSPGEGADRLQMVGRAPEQALGAWEQTCFSGALLGPRTRDSACQTGSDPISFHCSTNRAFLMSVAGVHCVGEILSWSAHCGHRNAGNHQTVLSGRLRRRQTLYGACHPLMYAVWFVVLPPAFFRRRLPRVCAHGRSRPGRSGFRLDFD